MENTMMMPAGYTAVSDEEMTYLCGGDGNSFLSNMGVPFAVVGALSVANMIWGVSRTRTWIQQHRKTSGDKVQNTAELVVNGIDSGIDYASKSIWKAVVSVYTFSNLLTWWPVTAIAWLSV